MQLRTRDMKLIRASCKPAARLTQDKHKAMPLLRAKAARQLPTLVTQINPRPGSPGCHQPQSCVVAGSASAQPSSFIPYHKWHESTSWYAGHKSRQEEVRLHCFATHRTICLVFTYCGMDQFSSIVLWLTLKIIIFYGVGEQPTQWRQRQLWLSGNSNVIS